MKVMNACLEIVFITFRCKCLFMSVSDEMFWRESDIKLSLFVCVCVCVYSPHRSCQSVPVVCVELHEFEVGVHTGSLFSSISQRICRHLHPQWLLNIHTLVPTEKQAYKLTTCSVVTIWYGPGTLNIKKESQKAFVFLVYQYTTLVYRSLSTVVCLGSLL